MQTDFLNDPGYKFSFKNSVLRQLELQNRRKMYAKRPDIWAYDVLGITTWSAQAKVMHSVVNNHNTMVAAGHGVGKALGSEESHITPTGWIKTKDITVGQELYDEQGDITRVTGLSPWWDQEVFRVTFDDGETIEAGENHEWNAIDLTRRSRADGTKNNVKDWRNLWHTSVRVTTREMYDSFRTSANQLRWKIPNTRPLQVPEADLPVEPYLMGFWLGDGAANGGAMAIGTGKGGFKDHLTALGFNYVSARQEENYEVIRVHGLKPLLREAGVLDNKHIPIEYLRASESQRRALLAGIMDSDGFLMKPSGGSDVGIDLTRKVLAEGVRELVNSLGHSVHWREGDAAYTLDGERRITGTRHRMNWTPDQNPFRLRGQGWSLPDKQASRHTARTIKSIESVGRQMVRCIEVDSPSHLYLAGRGMIPTHNSLLAAVLVLWWIDTHPLGEAIALTTAPSTHQVRQILWRNIQKLHADNKLRHNAYLQAVKDGESVDGLPDHKLPGYITSSATWRSDDGIMLAYGRTAPRGREGDAMQGVHGSVLTVVDEAVGVSEDMIQTMGNNTSTENDRQLLIANPTNPMSYMGRVWNDPVKSQAWNRITISVFDSPKFTDEHLTLPSDTLKDLTDQSYVNQKLLEYGEGSANYISRVLGQWATESGMILFPDEVLEVGLATTVIPDEDKPARVGFDVSRSEKGDFSYLYTAREGWVYQTSEFRDGPDGFTEYDLEKPRKTDKRGLQIRYLDRWRGLPFFPIHNNSGQRTTTEAANERVHAQMTGLGATQLRYDSDGMGKIMGDAMLDVTDNSYDLIPIKGNGASSDRDTWYNLRAEAFSELARRMRMGEIDIQADTEEHPLVKQLGAIEYRFASGFSESILIESKKDMAARGIKSPDAADAAWYAAVELQIAESLPAGTHFDLDMNLYAGGMYSESSYF